MQLNSLDWVRRVIHLHLSLPPAMNPTADPVAMETILACWIPMLLVDVTLEPKQQLAVP